MKRLLPCALVAPALLFLLVSACRDEPLSTAPAEPEILSSVASGAAPEAHANSLIRDLFPPPTLLAEASRFFADLKGSAARGDVAAAGEALAGIMALGLAALESGDLLDPPGPTTREEGLAELFEVLLVVGGLGEVELDPGVLDGSTDGVVAVVAPSETETTVTTEQELAGATFPPGAVDEAVLVVIQRREDLDVSDCLPLPPSVTQYEGCYQFDVIPDQDFNADVVVGVCLEGRLVADDVRLHKFRDEEPELGVKPLPTAQAPFLDCPQPPLSVDQIGLRGEGGLTRLAARLVRGFVHTFLAEPLRATHNGVGGLTINFSHIGWADDNPLTFDSERDNADSVDVFTAASDGAHPTNLTQNPGSLDANPKWSPDGTRIAFRSNRTGDAEVWLMNADGTGLAQVTQTAGFDNPHDWLPGGDSLVITSVTQSSRGVFVIATDGTGRRLVIDSAGSAAVSPDGTRIAVEHTDPTTGLIQVFLVDRDGTNRVRLTTAGENLRPSWSPDGARIAFMSVRDGNQEVYVMDADGSDQVNVTNNAAVDTEPAWSGDGGRIAFQTDRDGNFEIYVIDPDGGDPRRITDDPAADRNADWIR